MKLHKLLFENIDQQSIINALETVFVADTTTADQLRFKYPISTLELAKKFYDQNRSTFDKILSDATQFTYLGSGSKGIAFDLGGNTVLKLEMDTAWDTRFQSSKRGEKSVEALYSASPLGKAVPMIYDKGVLKLDNSVINWTLLEKFEVIEDPDILMDINDLIDEIRSKMDGATSIRPATVIKNYDPIYRDIIKNVKTNLVLHNDWFPKLVADMWRLRKTNIADFHAGNIGIRRIGSSAQGWITVPGYLVFFD